MGVDLGDVVLKEKRKLGDFKGRIIAIDAYNALYQFISIIRQPDGTPLTDSNDRVTSHLTGLLYRTANLVEAGIKLVYVFDGKPSPLKMTTVEGRSNIRNKAAEEWKKALEEGDIEKARTKAMQSSRLTPGMVDESIQLLDMLGVPFVQAPSEGEAQAGYMAKKGEVYAVGSQDFDVLLFNAPWLIRNLTVTGRRKLPRKNVYVNVEPEEIRTENVLKHLDVTIEQFVDIGILVGTDFNEGIKGVGPKTALKLIKEHKNLENVLRNIGEEIRDYDEVRKIFLEPRVTDDYEIEWKNADENRVKEFLCEMHDFSVSRVENALKKFQIKTQKSLEEWF
ncbi:MAG: flap endonuclease-1 [Candidatus Thermoplasmatota archaeon]|nr:flap endonuclease-1 [Candidatus Thermoplasmatota archaeon]